MDTLPRDPVMLMSVVNTLLRDRYPSLTALCDDLGINAHDLLTQLHDAGFDYLPDINQFR